MNILYEAVALEELADEDWKTQAARKYPNIPKGSKVNVLQENMYNWYGGPWTRVEWNDNWYWVNSKKVAKIAYL